MIVHFPEIQTRANTADRQQYLSGVHDHGFWCRGFGGRGAKRLCFLCCDAHGWDGAPQAQPDECPTVGMDGARSIMRGTSPRYTSAAARALRVPPLWGTAVSPCACTPVPHRGLGLEGSDVATEIHIWKSPGCWALGHPASCCSTPTNGPQSYCRSILRHTVAAAVGACSLPHCLGQTIGLKTVRGGTYHPPPLPSPPPANTPFSLSPILSCTPGPSLRAPALSQTHYHCC